MTFSKPLVLFGNITNRWMPFHSSLLTIDVNSWLVTFGFHLHNVIPGYPIPKFDMMIPSFELKKSQIWNDLPVSVFPDFFS